MLDVSGRLVVIVGGGTVAVRKAAGLISSGACRIRCVAPEFSQDLPESVECIVEEYAERHLEGAGLVFAATDREDVNDSVVRDARRMGVLVSRADANEAEPGDFSTPAKLLQGPIMITVSAGSPALAATIRDDLARKLDLRFVAMAEAMQELRPVIRNSRLTAQARAQVFRDLAGDEAINALHAGGMTSLRDWLSQKYPELNNG